MVLLLLILEMITRFSIQMVKLLEILLLLTFLKVNKELSLFMKTKDMVLKMVILSYLEKLKE